MKILIIRFSSIGDIVLTSPVIRCLKEQVPNIELHYATKKSYKSILENDKNIDKLFLLEDDLSSFIGELKKENYDYVIDLHKNIRTLKIKWSLGVKSYSFDKLNIRKWLLVNLKINRMPNKHIVDRYMETVSHLGVKNDGKGLYFSMSGNAQVDFSKYDVEPHQYIVFAIGGQHETKKMPNHKIVEICNQLKTNVILIGGVEDKVNGDEIVKSASNSNVQNLSGDLSIHQSAYFIKHAKYVITHDTGMMHISAAMKKKTYAIWGSTVPEFGMYPYMTEREDVHMEKLQCRPCSKIGYSKCPKKHFKCMNDINIYKYFN